MEDSILLEPLTLGKNLSKQSFKQEFNYWYSESKNLLKKVKK